MLENIIVGIILVAAAGFTVYRLFFRPSCGCGSDCGCDKGSCNCSGQKTLEPLNTTGAPAAPDADKDGKNGGGCCCGK